MRTDMGRGRRGWLAAALLSAAGAATHGAWAAEEAAGSPEAVGMFGADWQSWRAANDVSDIPSVQRGARNFVSYCLGCHSLKYERWSRLGEDLGVPPRLLQQDLLPPGDKPAQYILTGMPHVLSELEGLKRAVYKEAASSAEGGQATHQQVFDHFEPIAPGRLSAAEYDGFVRDTVNFLDYVSEPTQTARRALGVWVVLFVLVFTWLAWLVKREYWKDVH